MCGGSAAHEETNQQVQEKEKGETYRKLLMEVEAMTEKLKSSIQRDTATQEALDEEVCSYEVQLRVQALKLLVNYIWTLGNSA